MPRPSEPPVLTLADVAAPDVEMPRGYSLLAVIIIAVVILTGASTLAILARESNLTGSSDKKNAEAHAVAITGLTWGTLNLSNSAGANAINAAATGATPQLVAGVNVHQFNPDSAWGGLPAAPPAKGVSNTDWTAFGNGHYGLIAAPDPRGSGRSVLLRVLAVVGDAKVMLETSLVLNILQSVPAAFVGCLDDTKIVTYYDEEGPYDYTGNFRIDGVLGFPIGVSNEHNRLNGLSRAVTLSTTAPFEATDPSTPISITDADPVVVGNQVPPTNHQWRGTQTLTEYAAATPNLASGVSNVYGGVNDGADGKNFFQAREIGPRPGWKGNPFLGNDPRLADTVAAGGLGLNVGGWVWAGGGAIQWAHQKRGVPLTGTRGGLDPTVDDANDANNDGVSTWALGGGPEPVGPFPDNSAAPSEFLAESNWSGKEDDESRKGFYACDNHGGESGSYPNKVTELCLKGAAGTGHDYTDSALNHSGRAFGIMQMVLRQCTGSGDSIDITNGSPFYDAGNNRNGIKCAPGFEWLENVAACTIFPRSAVGAHGNNPQLNSVFSSGLLGDGNDWNNFSGCHPGCLIAVDADKNGSIDASERPFRSSCINLDATTVSVYGPGVFRAKKADVPALGASPYFGATGADLEIFADGHPTYSKKGHTPYQDPNTAGDTSDDWQQYNYGVSGSVAPGGALAARFGADGDLAQFKDAAGNWVGLGGAVAERGGIQLLTRLDMTDRGPLGTCEQNCLAYGYGKDMTYGAHRTDIGSPGGTVASAGSPGDCRALVPSPSPNSPAGTPAPAEWVHCNLDYDGDGLLDRYTHALFSSYREKCVSHHDGIPYLPAVDISGNNAAIAGAGCVNDMPNFAPGVTPMTFTQFCSDGSEAELDQSITELETLAVAIGPANLQQAGDASSVVMKEDLNWLGGAKCHLGNVIAWEDAGGNTVTGHPAHTGALAGIPNTDVDALGRPDYWIEDVCPNPGVYKLTGSANINPAGWVCGCGILILGNNTISYLSNKDGHFLWRGLVVWNLKGTGGEVLEMPEGAQHSLIIEGALLAYSDDNIEFKFEKPVTDATDVTFPSFASTLKIQMRFNAEAISQAFNGIAQPVRTVRRIH